MRGCYLILWMCYSLLPDVTAAMYPAIDSIGKLLVHATEEEKPALYYELAHAHYYADSLVVAAYYYEKAAEGALNQKAGNPTLVCEGYGNAGHCYMLLNRYRDAILNFEKGLQTAIEHEISLEESIAYLNLGTTYFNLGDYERAATLFNKSLAIDQELNDEEGVGINYANLGKVYEAWERFDTALSFYQKAFYISESNSDSARMAIRLSSMAMAHRGMNAYDKAIPLLTRALEIDRNLQAEARVGIRLSNLGQIYLDVGNYSEARNHLLPAIEIFKRAQNLRSLAIAYNQLGNVQLQTGNMQEAIDLYDESLAYARQIELLATIMKNHHDLSTIYELTGNYQDALANYKIYSQLKDSIFTDQSRQTLQEIETKYEIAQTEAEIALLTREKEAQMLKLQRSQWQMIFFLAASAMLVVLVIILISRYRIKQHANRQLQLLNATKDRFFTIIAHDLKNPLVAFRNITLGLKNALPQLQPSEISCYMDEIHRSADQLNELLANLLQWSRSQTGLIKQCKKDIIVKDMVDNVLQSLDAETRQKGIKISTMTEPTTQIFADEHVVSAVLRNIVSNAVRFSDNDKEIMIRTNRENHSMHFHVEDQGPGLTENEIQKLFRIDADTKSIGTATKKGTGLGLILCKELLDKEGGKIWVHSVKGKGSTFSFTIPA